MKIKKILIVLLSILMLTSCGVKELKGYRRIESLDNLDGRKVGVVEAWEADYILTSRKDVILFRYDTVSDMLLALMYKQLDAIAVESVLWATMKENVHGVDIFPEPFSYDDFVALTHENETLTREINEFIASQKDNPRYLERQTRINNFANDYVWPEDIKLSEKTGKKPLRVVIPGTDCFPFAFLKTDGSVEGFDIEFLYDFCNAYNYEPKITVSTWNDAMYSLKLDNYDMVISFVSTVYHAELETGGLTLSDVITSIPLYLVEITDPENLGFDPKLDLLLNRS